ncbi:hypothetical protein ASJ79_27230 [Mycobacterium sp. NAZ190054]|nr:hypothetical protein ASJ79_27230 [Mycobacterium sp. NAZ190054]
MPSRVGPRCTTTSVGGTSAILMVLFSEAKMADDRGQQPGGHRQLQRGRRGARGHRRDLAARVPRHGAPGAGGQVGQHGFCEQFGHRPPSVAGRLDQPEVLTQAQDPLGKRSVLHGSITVDEDCNLGAT